MRVWRLGDNVDTDVIVPGKYMKFGIEEIAKVRGFNRASAARLLEALAGAGPALFTGQARRPGNGGIVIGHDPGL